MSLNRKISLSYHHPIYQSVDFIRNTLVLAKLPDIGAHSSSKVLSEASRIMSTGFQTLKTSLRVAYDKKSGAPYFLPTASNGFFLV